MASTAVDSEFNTILFEKKLTNLKDSQESINKCCHWCLENRQYHKKIVVAWLNVLKRVKVEHRLTLFYLANDVIQYSKRRNYEFVESWGTTLQKATTMVRDEKVKHKILRIFKIWEQRGIYGEEFITDLSGLISVSPSARKTDEPHEFQSSYLVTKIRSCSKLESDTDLKLKKFKEHNPKMMDGEALCSSLKDRAHVDDVEKEMDDYVAHMEAYVNALKLEIKARNNIISLLTQADSQLENDKKDVKLVANAYKTFASRVKALKKKLEEVKPTLVSPIPSPDVNAPSPSPDSDIDLPSTETTSTPVKTEITQSIYTNAGFYNPVPPPNTEPSSGFLNNGFTSFMGTNMPFNIQSLNASLFGNSQTTTTPVTPVCVEQTQTTDIYNTSSGISSLFPSISQPPPPPAPVPAVALPTNDFQYGSSQIPLMPPPIPPFSKESSYSNPPTYTDSYSTDSSTNYGNSPYEQSSNQYQPTNTAYPPPPVTAYQPSITTYPPPQTTSYLSPNTNYSTPSYDDHITTFQDTSFPPPPPPVGRNFPAAEEYNPEEEPETWEPETNWDQPPIDLETPESPPIFEKEGYCDPIEYHDTQSMGSGVDIDHRVLTLVPPKNNSDNEMSHRKKDVDHRNLISLTGSPKSRRSPILAPWNSRSDQDYRSSQKPKNGGDQDYRVPFNFENLKLPPPPPPPNQNMSPLKMKKQSPRKGDNVESIDMDMSDEDVTDAGNNTQEMTINDNLKVIPLVDDIIENTADLEPPPPFPDFTDDADASANDLLDDLNNDLDELEDADDLLSALDDEDDLANMMNPPPPYFHEDPQPRVFNNEFHNNGPPRVGPPNTPFEQKNMPYGGPPNALPNGPPIMINMQNLPPNMNNLPPNINNLPPPMGDPNWMEIGFNQNFSFRGRGKIRGNFNNRGDFRGRPRGAPWRGRGNFRGNNNRGGPHMRGNNRGFPRGGRPFFRGQFRGAF